MLLAKKLKKFLPYYLALIILKPSVLTSKKLTFPSNLSSGHRFLTTVFYRDFRGKIILLRNTNSKINISAKKKKEREREMDDQILTKSTNMPWMTSWFLTSMLTLIQAVTCHIYLRGSTHLQSQHARNIQCFS